MEDGNSNIVPGFYPTEMDANVSIYSNSIAGEWRRYDFCLNLNLDNPAELDNGPNHPHIGYNFSPAKGFKADSKVLELNKPQKKVNIKSVDVSTMEKQFTDKKCAKRGNDIDFRAGHVMINYGEHLPDRGRSMPRHEVDAHLDPEFRDHMLDAQTVFMTPVNDLHQIRRFTTKSSSQYEPYELERLHGRYVTKEDWKEL
jgi:hypothetical protein